MKRLTLLLNDTSKNGCENMHELDEAVIDRLRSGHSIVFPTSTQPGLASIPEPAALDNLFSLKNRDSDKPVSLGVAELNDAAGIVKIPSLAEDFLKSFPKGSITLLMDAIEEMDPRLGGDKVAIRVLSHPVARRLAELVGPITATSANLAGEEVEGDVVSAAKSLGLGIESILSGECAGGLPSTLVRLIEPGDSALDTSVTVMREGVVSIQDVVAWSPN